MDYSNLADLPEEELNRILSELEELNADVEGLYIPHAKQREFHCATEKIRGLFGGNRSGKTQAGFNEAKFHATGQYPEWYPKDKRWSGPTRGRIVVTDFRKGGGEVLEESIKKWLSPEEIVKVERSMGNLSKVHVRHITGGVSTFDVMTHEQDTNQFEGWSGHWVWFDEPPPRDKYIACLRGMVDFDGRLWITATPITEPWLFDEIILNEKREAWHRSISMYDNPHLKRESIEEFIISLTPEEKEARVYGKFLHLTGRVYGDLDASIHCIEDMPAGHETWPIWFALDPADRRPHHGLWAKVDPFNNIYIFDEIVFAGTIKDTSKEILKREISHGLRQENIIRILDPNKGRCPSLVTGLRLVDEFASHALYFTADVNDDVALGHMAVREKLSYNKSEPISSTNHPKLYFVRNSTRECIKQLLSYVWDDHRGRNSGTKSSKEQVKDINKDLPDALRYIVMSRPQFYALSGSTRVGFALSPVTGYPE